MGISNCNTGFGEVYDYWVLGPLGSSGLGTLYYGLCPVCGMLLHLSVFDSVQSHSLMAIQLLEGDICGHPGRASELFRVCGSGCTLGPQTTQQERDVRALHRTF